MIITLEVALSKEILIIK
ncbi:MAG: hypothetical protein ACLTDP_02585 [Terrisporobacter sp.]